MEENKNTARLFHVEIAQGIYLISDPEQGPTEGGKSLAPGNATANFLSDYWRRKGGSFGSGSEFTGTEDVCGKACR